MVLRDKLHAEKLASVIIVCAVDRKSTDRVMIYIVCMNIQRIPDVPGISAHCHTRTVYQALFEDVGTRLIVTVLCAITLTHPG